jgi:hypothetical protein
LLPDMVDKVDFKAWLTAIDRSFVCSRGLKAFIFRS